MAKKESCPYLSLPFHTCQLALSEEAKRKSKEKLNLDLKRKEGKETVAFVVVLLLLENLTNVRFSALDRHTILSLSLSLSPSLSSLSSPPSFVFFSKVGTSAPPPPTLYFPQEAGGQGHELRKLQRYGKLLDVGWKNPYLQYTKGTGFDSPVRDGDFHLSALIFDPRVAQKKEDGKVQIISQTRFEKK